ncbi:MAG: hypothetical protein WDN06_06265 [Asticcacaulis sp.]
MPLFPNPLEAKSGNWAGADFSAGKNSPSFVPYTVADKAVMATSGFDQVSKTHDLAYEAAQVQLISDLVGNVSPVAAVTKYLTTLEAADSDFARDAPDAQVNDAHEERVRDLGVVGMGLKADSEKIYIKELNTPGSDLAVTITKLATNDKDALVSLFKEQQGFSGDPENADQIAKTADKMSLLTQIDTLHVSIEAILDDPTLIPEAAAAIPAMAAYVIGEDIDSFTDFVGKEATVVLDDTEYYLDEALETVSEAGEAVAKFLSDQVQSATDWVTSGSAGFDIAQWLSGNVANLLNGNMNAEQALISFAKFMGEKEIKDFVASNVLTGDDANGVIKDVIKQFGIPDDTATLYAGSVAASLTSMAETFVTSGFDAEQAIKAGTATIAGNIASTYLTKVAGWSFGEADGAAAAVTTAIQGLLNSSDFDGADWARLGVQVGIAAGAAIAGDAIVAYFIGNPLTYTNRTRPWRPSLRRSSISLATRLSIPCSAARSSTRENSTARPRCSSPSTRSRPLRSTVMTSLPWWP